MRFSLPSSNKGFTLIELLVVIAVLGVLAAGVLIAIDPVEQLARGRDSGRTTAVTELGRSVLNYYTNQASYPTQDTSWMTTLQNSGDIKIGPSNPSYSKGGAYTPACGSAASLQNGYCYGVAGGEAVVFAKVESTSEFKKAGCSTGQVAWVVWSSAASRTGLTCTADVTTYPTTASTLN